mgnify:CR=1 FL=1
MIWRCDDYRVNRTFVQNSSHVGHGVILTDLKLFRGFGQSDFVSIAYVSNRDVFDHGHLLGHIAATATATNHSDANF